MKKYVISFVSLSFTLLTLAQPRVEPMHWWTGMKDPMVQLLVHFDNIGETQPIINTPLAKIKKVHKAESSNYLFIDLEIARTARAGSFSIRFMKNGKAVHEYTYQLHARKPGSSQVKGFSAADVIYLITPDRVANGDPSNDINNSMRETRLDRKNDYGRHGGDLRGITDKLDYIADMGYTAIWSTPVLENDMKSSSYHGYAITDHYKVDPRFGTMAEYIELADKARAKGIKMVFDGVANHTGSEYWWMKDLPFRTWINYADSYQNTNHRRTVHQDPYASKADRELMVNGWFVRQMPDLNQENTFLANYLIQNNIWWIETLGLAGIRQDTYPYSNKKFLEQWSCRIMNEYPNFNIVGEEWSVNPLITSYWQQGKTNNSGYKGCMKSTMDFPMQALLMQALTEQESWDKGLVKLYEGLANDFVYADPQQLLVFGDNHDMDRLFTQVKNDVDLHQMALTYLLTTRGIPQIYYGTEVLIENTAKPGDHGLIRTDFPGGWNGDKVNGFSGAGLSADQQRIQSFMKKILSWRKNKTVIHTGKTMHFAPANGVYVFFRYNEKEKVMVVLNKSKNPEMIELSKYDEILKGIRSGFNNLIGEKIILNNQINVPAKSALIIEW